MAGEDQVNIEIKISAFVQGKGDLSQSLVIPVKVLKGSLDVSEFIKKAMIEKFVEILKKDVQ